MTRRTLGVIGTLVWDRIVGHPDRGGPVEEWGGIAYALAGLGAALPETWSVRPILKVGSDLEEPARAFLGSLPRIDARQVVVVEEPNNRVELRYRSAQRRTERLTGGVPPWTWPELAPRVAGCDAVYVNFISGFELGMEAARALGRTFEGPTWADLHSLFLGIDRGGLRVPRAPADAPAWLRLFDAVQLNEDELALLGGDRDGWTVALDAMRDGPSLVTVTLGEGGAAYAATAADAGGVFGRSARSTDPPPIETIRTEPRGGDPTGCGDVWGATVFARLLAGDPVAEAITIGNRLAGRSLERSGAGGLLAHLSGVTTGTSGTGT